MTDIIERFILFCFLVAFAYFGLVYGVPKVGGVLRDKLQASVEMK